MKLAVIIARSPRIRSATAALVALCLGAATVAQAQLLESEGFDYTGAALNGQNGGTGWTKGGWSDPDADAPLSNDGVSLAFPVAVSHTTAGSRLAFGATAGEATRTLGTSMSLNAESTYFVSALIKRQGPFLFEFRDAAGNIRWHFGGTNTADAIAGVANNNAAQIVVTPGIFPSDETVYIVAKLVAHAAVNDQVYMNVYRAGDTLPTLEPGSWQVAANGGSGVILTNLQIRTFDAAAVEVDEIHIGRDWSSVVAPFVTGPPSITRQPASVTAYEGVSLQLSVEATGQLPLFFQWRQDGQPLADQTNAILSLPGVAASQAGSYTVRVTNSEGEAISDPAVVSVTAITDISLGRQAVYHLDETFGLTAYDEGPSFNNGTLYNFANDDSQWVAGMVNSALAFGGSNYVEAPSQPGISTALTNAFSVATWFKSRVPLTTNSQVYRMLEKENSFFLLQGDGNPNNLGIGGMNLLVKKAGANIPVSIGQNLDADRWYHIAGTFDGAAIRIYLDGELMQTRAVAAPLDSTALPLRIGSDYLASGTGTKFFNGLMDEVGLWERPLLPSEIATMAGPPGIDSEPQPVTRFVGSTAVLRVLAHGQGPLQYLWYNGTNEIRSATSNVLTLINVQLSDAGNYSCRISNVQGGVISAEATLTVTPVSSITDGAEALWKFDEFTGLIAADSSGNGRDGQLTAYLGDDTQWGAGQVNAGLSFDGQANRVIAANSTNLNLGYDATFAFWIRPTNYGTIGYGNGYTLNTSRIIRKGTHFDLEVVDDPGSVRATLRANGVPAPQYSLQLDQWQHFVVVFSGGTVSFYKNGFRLTDPAPANLGAANTNVVVLGNITDSLAGTNLFAGAMDEVGVWNRVLGETEILNLAGRDIAGEPVLVSQPQAATRYVGGSVSFQVDATGRRPMRYQWLHDGTPLPDSDTNRLVLGNLALSDAGGYAVTVTNDVGDSISAPPALLTVLQVTNIGSGLVGYWTFDETTGTTFADASGRGHDAAIQGASAVPGTVGVIGGAFNFDGVDDFAIVPHAPDLNLADQATVSVWVSPRRLSVQGGLGRIVRKDINVDLSLVTDGNTMRLYGLNKTIYDAPANTVTTNAWQHLAVVIKDHTIQFFKNGRSVAPPIPGQLGPDNLSDLIIANFGPNLTINRLFDGYMDDLGMWNRALGTGEIDGIYQNGLLGHPLNAPFEPFEVRSIDLATPGQVRLTFSSPYNGQTHVVQRKDLLDGVWTNQAGVAFADLGDGLTEARFNQPEVGTAFYRVAVLPQPPIFSEDFETGAPGWTHGGAGDNWEMGVPVNGPGAAYGGTNVYATSLTGNIEPFSDSYLRSPVISLAGASRATLTFQEWRNVDPDPTFHGTIVNVLDANTLAVLQQLSTASGATTGYQLRSLTLPPQLLGRNVILEFRLYCDGFNLLEGWYLDDVQILPQ